jgi:hypothetical protein
MSTMRPATMRSLLSINAGRRLQHWFAACVSQHRACAEHFRLSGAHRWVACESKSAARNAGAYRCAVQLATLVLIVVQ